MPQAEKPTLSKFAKEKNEEAKSPPDQKSDENIPAPSENKPQVTYYSPHLGPTKSILRKPGSKSPLSKVFAKHLPNRPNDNFLCILLFLFA